ncbi:G-protein coupled receptor 161-like [Mya arenaria]|uniref:G-protein coupled receptor 161-like n=1 Tax=Mya arenaria TaxID=6604 RepID=UPI0022E69600|nr:G-protein coupled receptor 161-like [Mya arenaria]
MQLNESTRNLSSSVIENEDSFIERQLDMFNLVIMAIGLFVIFIVSFAGNISVFVIFYRRPVLLTISNRFIINLTFCNILQTVVVIPFVFASLISQKWWFGSFWCQASGFGMNLIFTASTFTLVLIAIDRYMAVAKPLHYSMTMTSRRASFMIASVWISAILCSLPPLFGWNCYEFQLDKISCMTVSFSKHHKDRSYSIIIVTLSFILPSCIIMWAYCAIFKAAKLNIEKVRRNSTIASGLNDYPELSLRGGRRNSSAQILIHKLSCSSKTGSGLWKRDERKAAVTSFMVLFTFVLCWLLYFIIIILECILNDPDHIEPVVKTLSVLLALSSCAINPLVYVFRCKLQRVEFKSIFGIKQNSFNTEMGNGNQNGYRRPSFNPNYIRKTPCISREGSQESEVIEILHLS